MLTILFRPTWVKYSINRLCCIVEVEYFHVGLVMFLFAYKDEEDDGKSPWLDVPISVPKINQQLVKKHTLIDLHWNNIFKF